MIILELCVQTEKLVHIFVSSFCMGLIKSETQLYLSSKKSKAERRSGTVSVK